MLYFHKGSQSKVADELWIYTELIVQRLSRVDKPLVHFSLIHFDRELSYGNYGQLTPKWVSIEKLYMLELYSL